MVAGGMIVDSAVAKQVAHYLDAKRQYLLESWMSQVMIDSNDRFKDHIIVNGTRMLDVVIAYLSGRQINDARILQFAQRVSAERLEANVNIGEFVYNVTIGRSEILDCLVETGFTIRELTPIIHTINALFDRFLYFAVLHYTELKNQQISEQSSFIEQTHKDKLTLLGQMSSSFVHEFRNPLTSVIGFVQLLQSKYPSLEYIDILTKELEQLKFRITQFLLISKKGVDRKERETFRIGHLFDETLEFLYPMIVSTNVSIEREIDDSLYLLGYRDEFRQVLINIIMNSLDALSASPVKRIIKGYRAGNQLMIQISNSGPPIPKEMISTIFEPFVSSKALGTGIGLYVCRNIIHEHGGIIRCESDDELTTFRIEVPIGDDDESTGQGYTKARFEP